jgi:transglutaminase-like putative cysteine protease
LIWRALLGWPHVLRAIALALSALSLAWGVALTEGLVAAMVGAAGGSIAGQHLARSKLRLGTMLAACGIGVGLALGLASLFVGTEALPRLLGPANTLRVAGCLRFGALAFAIAAALRGVAARKPAAMSIELAFVALSITTVFAAHRDGIIARPLWLSDWAWRQGIDPANILLGIGGVAAGTLAILLLLETKSRRPVSSLVVVTALAILAATFVNAMAMPAPDPLNDLGLTQDGNEDAGSDAGKEAGADASADAGSDARSDMEAARGAGADAGLDAGEVAQSGFDGGSDQRPSSIPWGVPPSDVSGGAGGPPSSSSTPSEGGEGNPSRSSRDELSDKQNPDEGPSNSSAPMAVVLLENDYSPPSQAYYFREEALSQYNGARLVVSSVPGTDLDIPSAFPSAEARVASEPPAEGRERVGTTVVLLTEHGKPFVLESALSVAPAPNPNPSRFTRAYRATSLSQSIDYKDLKGRAAGDARWPAEVRAHYSEPPLDPRYAALATKITKSLPEALKKDPFALALAVKLYLEKELTYSTSSRHAGVPDPTADMLFGDRIGYCVHFAHAAVFLWRSLGLPARVSVGYRSEEDNRKGGSAVLLRASDAHAWPELYLEGAGWIILDIASAQNLDPPRPAVDDELQRLLGQMARGEPPEDAEERGQTIKLREALRWLGAAGLIGVAVTVVLLYLIKIWRRVSPRFADARSMPVVVYRCALDLLAEAGLTRHFGETREAFARRAQEVAPAFEELTWMHLAAKLGRGGGSEGAWREALEKVRGEIAERGRLGRRVLGAINPASFLDAR